MGLSRPNFDIFAKFYFTSAIFLLLVSFRSKFLQSLYLHGKHRKSSENVNTLSFLLVSKNRFIHFYLLGLIVNSVLLYIELPNVNIQRIVFHVHLIRRSLEQFILFGNLQKESHMHLVAYIFGLSYYTIVPLCITNVLATWQLLLNIASQTLQSYSHYKLSVLRRNGVYKLPKEWPFNYILCPHYLAECLFYISLSCNTNMLLCTIFVILEMVVLGKNVLYINVNVGNSNKHWYQANFPGKLATRYSLLPYIF